MGRKIDRVEAQRRRVEVGKAHNFKEAMKILIENQSYCHGKCGPRTPRLSYVAVVDESKVRTERTAFIAYPPIRIQGHRKHEPAATTELHSPVVFCSPM